MHEKMVTIELSMETLIGLKKNSYALCFAKKVNDTYNVVWQSQTKYLARNRLSWVPEFEIFGTNVYRESIPARADTNVSTLRLGEQCILDEVGNLGEAVSGRYAEALTMVNEFGPIHTGVNQVCYVNDVQKCSAIYVSKEAGVKGEIVLTPKESVLIWFQPNVETSTIFEEARSNSLEIDLTNRNARTVSYDFETGRWTVVA